jgi:hypothetical protein
MTDLLKLLHEERATVAKRLAGLDAAISALNGNYRNTTPAMVKTKRTWKISAEGRARISAAGKKRWAKIKR